MLYAFSFNGQNQKFTHFLKPFQVSKHTLEHVRRVRNCMVRLNARAEALHDLLEKLVDSDSNLRDMAITAKQQVWAELYFSTACRLLPSCSKHSSEK